MGTLVTASGGVLGPIATILGMIMNAIYEFFYLFGIQNIALAIIFFTFIVRTLMLPLTIKQQKFTKLSSRMNPELQKIQAKYKGKKDEVSLRKQQEESQAMYQKYGANPTSGCLPMLITLPVMFALYSVINNIPAYVSEVKSLYETVALGVQGTTGYTDILKGIIDGTTIRVTNNNDFTTINYIIDVLAKFQKTHWDELKTSIPELQNVIQSSYENIMHVNNFLGLNIAEKPGWAFPGILIPILAMSLQFVQGKQLEVKNKGTNKDNPSANAMASMNVVMPIMSGVFCVTLPTGIGIYWIATSVYAIIQQYFVNKYMDRIDVDELIAKNVAKASKRKSFTNTATQAGASLQDLAKKQTRSIESSISDKATISETNDSSVQEDSTSGNSQESQASSGGSKSISEIANLLKNKNIDKGDK